MKRCQIFNVLVLSWSVGDLTVYVRWITAHEDLLGFTDGWCHRGSEESWPLPSRWPWTLPPLHHCPRHCCQFITWIALCQALDQILCTPDRNSSTPQSYEMVISILLVFYQWEKLRHRQVDLFQVMQPINDKAETEAFSPRGMWSHYSCCLLGKGHGFSQLGGKVRS